jgi:ribosome biogenesis GTPase
MHLGDLGWDETFARHFAEVTPVPGLVPGRVAVEFNHLYRVYSAQGELGAVVAGRFKHRAKRRSDLPAVGDWVAVRVGATGDPSRIEAVLPRRSTFSRKAAGRVTTEQVVAANIDVVFLVMALDTDFSIRRLERYLLLAREGGAAAVVLLTKPDMCRDVPRRVAEATAVSGDRPIHVVSPSTGEGLEQVSAHLRRGRTGALLGSSGVGKSTIINSLAGRHVQRTRDVRAADSRGRHTTTHRELVILPSHGLIIDTPGMRELQLWDVGEVVRETFEDIDALAADCYFSDCRHREEPRCAVKAAVEAGQLGAGRLTSYLKLQTELEDLARQQDERLQLDDKRRSKAPGRR